MTVIFVRDNLENTNTCYIYGGSFLHLVLAILRDDDTPTCTLNSQTRHLHRVEERHNDVYVELSCCCDITRLLVMPNNRYLRNCYLMQKSLDDVGRRTWSTYVKNLPLLYGFGYVWIAQDVGNANHFVTCFKKCLNII